MSNIKVIIFVLSIITSTSSNYLLAQTYKIFEGDTIYLKEANPLSYRKELKENLSDGHWLYYNIKDSTVKDYEQYLMVEGYYKDSLKHGKFTHYHRPFGGKKKYQKIRQVLMYKNYQKGLLDGYYCNYRFKDVKNEEGYFVQGKKHGFYIEYYYGKERKITTLKFFKNDTIQYSTAHDDKGLIVFNSDAIKGEVTNYDSLGVITSKKFYKNDEIIKHQEFDKDGELLKVVEGTFIRNPNFDYKDQNTPFKVLYSGVIKKYENGILKEEEHYFDGKLQKTIQIEN